MHELFGKRLFELKELAYSPQKDIAVSISPLDLKRAEQTLQGD